LTITHSDPIINVVDIDVQVMPDPADVMFDDAGTPILTFERHVEHGEGWVLYTLDENDGVDGHFIGGGLADLDWAEGRARTWLAL
jgi:hypothetical protein